MRIPTIKSLVPVFGDKAKQARKILEMDTMHLHAEFEADGMMQGYYNQPTKKEMRMLLLDKLGETHGVEAIALGNGEIVDYLNSGDTYTPTLVFWRGNYRVTDWGTLVERHGDMDLQEALLRRM